MADLTGSTIASSYDQLLAMPSGGGNGATLVALTDGNAGNTFALELSTGEVKSTGTLTVSGITTMAGDLRLEDDAGGEYFGIGTPATVTTYTLTVPAAVGGSGQALRTSDGSGTLEWYTPETGDITGVTAGTGLSGGGTSGTVTLNVEASQTQITALGTIGTGVWQGTAVDGTYIDLEGTELKSTGETGGTKYLREDGDGTCSWQAATATLTIDSTTIGSSTAGSVLFVNSSNQLSQDNAELFWDNTGNNLLVGKTSTDLDVDGVRIDSAGRIEVARTSTSTSLATNSGGNLSLANPSATDGNFSNIGGYNSNELVDSQINFIHTSHSSRTGEISFSTHSGTSLVEAVRIDSSGNVGIGRTPTTNILECEGTVSATTAGVFGSTARTASYSQVECYRSGNPYVIGYDTRSSATGTGGYIQWNVKGGDGGYDGVGAVGAVCTTTHATLPGGALVFHTAEAGSAAAEKMRISEAGLVGIGATPTVPLTVESAPSGGLVKFVHTAGTTPDGSAVLEVRGNDTSDPGAYDLLNLNNAGTVRMLVQADGNVGIGTDSPSRRLSVHGDSVTPGRVKISNSHADSSTIIDLVNDAADTEFGIYAGVADAFQIWHGTTGSAAARLTITTAGSIDLAASKLTIGGSSGSDGQVLTSDGAGNIAWEAGGGGVTALSEAADVEIDFSGTKHQTLTVTGTCTELSTTSLSAGKEIELRIYNNDGGFVGFTPTTPSWKEMGQSITSTGVDPTEYAILKLTSWGTTDADVTAELITQP